VDFVRQGAFIALGMILVEQSEASAPALATTRSMYHKIIGDKHEDPMARFGASVAQGLIDAGGRNVTISLQSRAGSRNTGAIVGMVLFCQFWYWFPLAHCVSLAFQPTGIIGVDGHLEAPKFDFVSNAKPSLFAYPAPTKPPKKEAISKVATAVLSTTARAKAREKKKAAAEGESMDTDEKDAKKDADVEMKADEPSHHGDVSPIAGLPSNLADGTEERKPAEPSFQTLSNFSRVTPRQMPLISFPKDSRYQPVRAVSAYTLAPGRAPIHLPSEKYAGGGGILIMVDQRPDEEAEYIEFTTTINVNVAAVAVPAAPGPSSFDHTRDLHISLDENAPEADQPEPFEYPFGSDT